VSISGLSATDLVSAVHSDKKLRRGKLSLPVPICVGEVKLLSVEPSNIGGAAIAAVI
jgi:3-dehydroquinate synthetase